MTIDTMKRFSFPFCMTLMIGFAIWFYVFDASGHSAAPAFATGELSLQRADGTKLSINAEIAKTQEQKSYGLMFRRSLALDHGMIFLWDEDTLVSMWMKDTFIPLDMLYVRQDGTIEKIIIGAVPQDLTPLPSGEPIRAVVELKAGAVQYFKLKTGDKVLYQALNNLK